jgi:hypothetical protein
MSKDTVLAILFCLCFAAMCWVVSDNVERMNQYEAALTEMSDWLLELENRVDEKDELTVL